MKESLSALKSTSEHLKVVFKPQFYRISTTEDKNNFLQLVDNQPFLTDDLYDQLKELIRSRFPERTFQQDEYKAAINEHIGGQSLEEYGVWVYYPWSNRLVHLLDKDEFIELRTSRNKYKITDKEEEILATKKVGVVGLSVGQSVSMTLCMERGVGEIRIADFDTLELTNINRIRSGVHNLGLHKAIIVAREIAEIDPFLKVVPFIDGLTLENMDRFFREGGDLDLVIDECDGLDMKIYMRQKAKEMRIPLLMEASDRGMLDVERYDLEPDRPFLHGLIDHLDASKIGTLTNDEKVAFILPFLGVDTISTRLKASMMEVGQSITTWPQLASAVTLGGALCADVCRRILLDQYHESGRYFVDIEDFVSDKDRKKEGEYLVTETVTEKLTSAAMIAAIDKLSLPPQATDAAIIREIAEAGAKAPSAGNNQPWKFLARNGALYVFHDKEKSASWFNHDNFIANISFGTVLENINLKATNLGYKTNVQIYPLGKDASLVYAIAFEKAEQPANKIDKELVDFVGIRCTNRQKGTLEKIDEQILDEFNGLVNDTAGSGIYFVTDQQKIEEVGAIVGNAERIRFLYPQTHHEFFKQELKWNDTGKEIIREGLDIKTLELSISDEVGMKVGSDPSVIATLNNWNAGKAFAKLSRKTIVTSGAIGLITMPGDDAEDFIQGGRVLERIWLAATKHKIALHPISAPLFLDYKIKKDTSHGLAAEIIAETQALTDRLTTIFPQLANNQGIFLFRLSRANEPTAKSLKLVFEDIYDEI